jgi:tRNA(Ile)-lysidine synthase
LICILLHSQTNLELIDFSYICVMLQAFKAYIVKEKLFLPGEKILLAVSGGMDSMAMVELFSRAKFSFGIAHCNFLLRGKESDADESFVKNLAKNLKVPFYIRQFSTTDYADVHGLSTQMAARELRYDWFNELLKKEGYSFLATAHHLDDQIETFFINMLRSTGIAGFHGILPRQGKIIRPLLFASRNEIEVFIKKNNLPFREDSSNQEIKYLRNKIRHELIPVLAEINPGFSSILTENIYRIREAEKIFRDTVNLARNTVIRKNKERSLISIDELKKLDPFKTYLFEFLSPFGFNYSVAEDISEALNEEAGKQFYSPTHRLIKDRQDLIITPLKSVKKGKVEKISFHILENNKRLRKPISLTLKKLRKDKNFKVDVSPEVANLDLHKVRFPLTLRKWQHGDHFHPFGRDHRKKLSDFFTDGKFSIDVKENTWILCSGEKIVWIVGHRIDNRFRITSKTQEVLQIKWLK